MHPVCTRANANASLGLALKPWGLVWTPYLAWSNRCAGLTSTTSPSSGGHTSHSKTRRARPTPPSYCSGRRATCRQTPPLPHPPPLPSPHPTHPLHATLAHALYTYTNTLFLNPPATLAPTPQPSSPSLLHITSCTGCSPQHTIPTALTTWLPGPDEAPTPLSVQANVLLQSHRATIAGRAWVGDPFVARLPELSCGPIIAHAPAGCQKGTDGSF